MAQLHDPQILESRNRRILAGLPPATSHEPLTRGLTALDIAMVAAGLDSLRRDDAATLASEIRNATAIVVVQKTPVL